MRMSGHPAACPSAWGLPGLTAGVGFSGHPTFLLPHFSGLQEPLTPASAPPLGSLRDLGSSLCPLEFSALRPSPPYLVWILKRLLRVSQGGHRSCGVLVLSQALPVTPPIGLASSLPDWTLLPDPGPRFLRPLRRTEVAWHHIGTRGSGTARAELGVELDSLDPLGRCPLPKTHAWGSSLGRPWGNAGCNGLPPSRVCDSVQLHPEHRVTLRPRLEAGWGLQRPWLQRRVPEKAHLPVLPPCPQPDFVCSKSPSLHGRGWAARSGEVFWIKFSNFS